MRGLFAGSDAVKYLTVLPCGLYSRANYFFRDRLSRRNRLSISRCISGFDSHAALRG